MISFYQIVGSVATNTNTATSDCDIVMVGQERVIDIPNADIRYNLSMDKYINHIANLGSYWYDIQNLSTYFISDKKVRDFLNSNADNIFEASKNQFYYNAMRHCKRYLKTSLRLSKNTTKSPAHALWLAETMIKLGKGASVQEALWLEDTDPIRRTIINFKNKEIAHDEIMPIVEDKFNKVYHCENYFISSIDEICSANLEEIMCDFRTLLEG